MKSIYSLKKKIVLNLVVYCRHAFFFPQDGFDRQSPSCIYKSMRPLSSALWSPIALLFLRTISIMHLWVQLSRRPFPSCIYELVRSFPTAHWSLRPLPSCIFPRGEAVRLPLPTIMHFFHEMGSWKNFGLIRNAVIDWKLFN
jgi:hypothetical protein